MLSLRWRAGCGSSGKEAEAFFAVPFEGFLVREVGGIGWEVDPLSGGGEEGEGGGGGAAGFGVEDDFVLVGDGEDALVEGPVDGPGEGEAVARVIGASDTFGNDVGGVGFYGGGVDEFLAGDGASAIVVGEHDVAEGLVALFGAHLVEHAVFLKEWAPFLKGLEA